MTATENRLREALSAAAETAADVRPLTAPARRRSRVPVLLAAAVTVAAVGAGFVWVRQADDPRTTTAAQATPTPQPQMEISVFLCKKNDPFPRCKGQRADKAEIAEALWSRPDVAWIGFQDTAKTYKNFRKQFEKDAAMLKAVRVEDMPESFRVVPEQGADWSAIVAAVKALPGVSNVVDQRRLSLDARRETPKQ